MDPRSLYLLLVCVMLMLMMMVAMADKEQEMQDDDQTVGEYDDEVDPLFGIVDEMLEGYDRQESPHGDKPTIVQLGIYVNSFYSINEQTMEYCLNIYLRQTWEDPRLAFTPPDGKESDMIKLADGNWDRLWVPDVFFRNEKAASFHHVTIPNRLMRLYSNGKIWYAMKISAKLACSMYLQNFPFDTQECPLLLESFGHTMDTVIFKFLDDRDPVEKDILFMPQFTMTDIKLIDCSMNYSTGAYPCLQIKFILRRDIGYYLTQVYVPSILIVILSWVAFWIDMEATAPRVSLGLVTVLTMTKQSAGARQGLPRVSYIKAIDVWMLTCLVFVFAGMLEYAFVHAFARKKIRKKSAPDPEIEKIAGPVGELNILVEVDRGPKRKKDLVPDPRAKTRALNVDKLARVMFPLSFAIFNLAYWLFYLVI